VKIKGHDYQFLKWALEESRRRKPINQLKRTIRYYWKRYASPRKVVRKLQRMALRPKLSP
jgi:hypothetical protein